jgi:hypothetical protein
VNSDVMKATDKGIGLIILDAFLFGLLTDGSYTRSRHQWSQEASGKFQAWRSQVSRASRMGIAPIEEQKRKAIEEIEAKMKFDLDKVRLSSQDLRSVTLLPDGDNTTVFLAFQISPEKLKSGGKLTLYSIPVKFDAAGTVIKRTNLDFPLDVK